MPASNNFSASKHNVLLLVVVAVVLVVVIVVLLLLLRLKILNHRQCLNAQGTKGNSSVGLSSVFLLPDESLVFSQSSLTA